MLNDFLSLIFPKVCAACGKSLFKTEESICTYCLYHLPKTNFHLYGDNPVVKLFWGRTNIHSASSLYSFSKGSKVQHLIHQLKYRGKKEIGNEVDVDATYNYTEDVQLGLSLGWFLPGDIFNSANDTIAKQALAHVNVNF